MSHFTLVPPNLVQPDGTLRVTMLNLYEQMPGQSIGRIYFEPDDFEVLYKVGDSRPTSSGHARDADQAGLPRRTRCLLRDVPEFPRGLSVILHHLHGGHARSLSGLVVGVLRADRGQSVDWTNIGVAIQWVFEMGIRQIARASVFMLEAFGEYRPTNDLVNGLVVSWGTVLSGFLRLAVIWSGLTLVTGWLVLRKRQLAIYSGGQS